MYLPVPGIEPTSSSVPRLVCHQLDLQGMAVLYSIACIYILPFVIMPTKYIIWGSILPIKVISVDCNKNFHHLITYKFPHFTFLW